MTGKFSQKLTALADEAENDLQEIFRDIDRISVVNTASVLESFRRNSVSESMFAPSDGYGYGDRGRDTLDKICAEIFCAESAFVRPALISGTHALSVALFGLLRPGDVLLSVTGKPYDTLEEVIGITGEAGCGSLADFGVEYRQIDLLPGASGDECINFPEIKKELDELVSRVKVVFVQRSKGYGDRPTLKSETIRGIASFVHKNSPAYVVVDNCYGEFTETIEPTNAGDPESGADLIVGSLIKNPGGGMAETGGYIAGVKRAVELCGNRLTTPGIGLHAGASLGQNKNIFKGFFYAPHTVAQAIKTAHFAAYILEKLGFETSPPPFERRSDIIQTVKLNTPEALIKFCRGIQSGAPVDAHVIPEPWDMPGYSDPVIMAAGAFVQGASIELSADGPLRHPYTAFIQGGLTYESGKYGIMRAVDELMREGDGDAFRGAF